MLDNIVNKYNETVHRTVKMKPIDVTSVSYAEPNKDSNVTKPKFKVGDHVRISKYKNILAKWYTPNRSEEIFVVSIITSTVLWWLMLLVTWMVSQLLEVFMKKNCKKLFKKNLEYKNLFKNGDKLYVKWKGFHSSFKSWINKKDPV